MLHVTACWRTEARAPHGRQMQGLHEIASSAGLPGIKLVDGAVVAGRKWAARRREGEGENMGGEMEK